MAIHEREYTGLTRHLPDAQGHPWIFDCDVDECYWMTAHASIERAELARDEHKCPLKGETRAGIDMTLINEIWKRLDQATIDVFEMDKTNEDERNKARGRARGLAECLQILCQPHYPSVDDVTRQAVKRYKMAKGQLEFEETPGAGGYNPAPAGTGPRVGGAPTAPARARPVKPKLPTRDEPQLPAEKLDGLKRGIEAGFPHAALARSYGVSVDYVARVALGK